MSNAFYSEKGGNGPFDYAMIEAAEGEGSGRLPYTPLFRGSIYDEPHQPLSPPLRVKEYLYIHIHRLSVDAYQAVQGSA